MWAQSDNLEWRLSVGGGGHARQRKFEVAHLPTTDRWERDAATRWNKGAAPGRTAADHVRRLRTRGLVGLHFLAFAAPLAASVLAPANRGMDGFQRFVTGRALRGDAA